MKSTKSISILHIIFLTMTVIGLKNHVTIIPPLLRTAGRDSWMSVLIATLSILPWLFLWIYIQNKSNQKPIKDWLKERIGKVGAFLIISLTALYLLFLAASTIRETLQWVNATFLPSTPVLIMLIIYTVLCTLLASKNIQTIAIVNAFLLFGIVVFGFFVAFTNLQVKKYSMLQPFFEGGFQPILKGSIYPASGFVEILIFLFLQHQITGRVRWSHLAVILLIVTGLTLGPLLGSIVEFGPTEAAKQRYPAYEEWGLVAIGSFVEHVDFFSIYQWLTGAFIRTSLFLYIVADLYKVADKPKKIWTMIMPSFLVFCLLLFQLQDDKFLLLEKKYLLPATFFFFLVLSLLLTIVAALSGKSKKGESQTHT